jgi:hypothetical protein
MFARTARKRSVVKPQPRGIPKLAVVPEPLLFIFSQTKVHRQAHTPRLNLEHGASGLLFPGGNDGPESLLDFCRGRNSAGRVRFLPRSKWRRGQQEIEMPGNCHKSRVSCPDQSLGHFLSFPTQEQK